MRDGDALENNPEVSRSALEAIHSQVFGWALSRCYYDQAAAEDLMQQAYVELLSGNARFDKQSSLKTFVFSVVQNLARSRFRRLASRCVIADKNTRPPAAPGSFFDFPDTAPSISDGNVAFVSVNNIFQSYLNVRFEGELLRVIGAGDPLDGKTVNGAEIGPESLDGKPRNGSRNRRGTPACRR